MLKKDETQIKIALSVKKTTSEKLRLIAEQENRPIEVHPKSETTKD